MQSDISRQIAVQKRDAARKEWQRWEDFIVMYDEIGFTMSSTTDVVIGDDGNLRRRRSKTGKKVSNTESAVHEILMEHNGPMHTVELLDALRQRGIMVVGKVPTSTLSARLSRSSLIEHNRPYGWVIKSRLAINADDEHRQEDTLGTP